MAIVGGALMPPIQGLIIDLEKVGPLPAVNASFILPLFCFIVVAIYGYRTFKIFRLFNFMKRNIDFMDSRYPSVPDLRKRAQSKIPKFAFEYLDGGCHDDVNLKKNSSRIREVELKPSYLVNTSPPELKTKLFGHTYNAPFGIAPVGLQGLMWPGAPEILAKAAFDHNLPFVLSTVSTASIEKISEITDGRAWFQLYHPSEERVTKDLLKRAELAGCPVLVILADVPLFWFSP
jgi:L-lactate dehydrogenase (cytochrome)